MPKFQVRVVNSDFESSNELNAADFEQARRHALRAALTIGSDEVCKGTPFFGAEVQVELDGKREKFVVSIGQSPLK